MPCRRSMKTPYKWRCRCTFSKRDWRVQASWDQLRCQELWRGERIVLRLSDLMHHQDFFRRDDSSKIPLIDVGLQRTPAASPATKTSFHQQRNAHPLARAIAEQLMNSPLPHSCVVTRLHCTALSTSDRFLVAIADACTAGLVGRDLAAIDHLDCQSRSRMLRPARHCIIAERRQVSTACAEIAGHRCSIQLAAGHTLRNAGTAL